MKKIREQKGLTQQKLAELTGISVGMIRHYEQGSKNINNAKLETLFILSDALDCNTSDILTEPALIKRCKQKGV